jgi:hypothetical protein
MIEVASAALALRARIGCTLRDGPLASPRGHSQEEDETIPVLAEMTVASS